MLEFLTCCVYNLLCADVLTVCDW